MSNLFRFIYHSLVIALVMTVDVRVRAITFEEPKKCRADQNSKTCAVYTENLVETITIDSAKVVLSQGSSVVKFSGSELKLIRGLVRVSANSKTNVKTIYGDIEFTSGEVLIETQDSLVRFTNLSADLKYSPRGENQNYSLPIGFSSYFAGITTSGVAETGYPKPAEIETLIKKWSRLYTRKEKSQFANSIKAFMKEWQQATQAVGPWYVEVVNRQIASQKAEEERLARLKAKREAENQVFRNMLKEKVSNY